MAQGLCLQSVEGGLALSMRLSRVKLYLRLQAQSVPMAIWSLSIPTQRTFGLRLENGVPAVDFDPAALVIERGAFSPEFSGFGGAILELFFPLLRSTVETEVDNALNALLADNIEGLLSSALGSLDLSAFSLGFDVSPLGGGDPVNIALATETTTLNVTEDRMRFGLGTTIQAPRGQLRPSAGVAIFGDGQPIERRGRGNIGAIIQTSMINQLMHGLWRAGFSA